MMMSSNGNIFQITGPLCGEFTSHWWIPLTKASDTELWFFYICAWIDGWANNRDDCDLRCPISHSGGEIWTAFCNFKVWIIFCLCHYSAVCHYSDVIMGAMVSQITGVSIVCSTVCSENIKASGHWPLWGEFTGDQWISHTKGQWHGKCFHLMKSSCDTMLCWTLL